MTCRRYGSCYWFVYVDNYSRRWFNEISGDYGGVLHVHEMDDYVILIDRQGPNFQSYNLYAFDLDGNFSGAVFLDLKGISFDEKYRASSMSITQFDDGGLNAEVVWENDSGERKLADVRFDGSMKALFGS